MTFVEKTEEGGEIMWWEPFNHARVSQKPMTTKNSTNQSAHVAHYKEVLHDGVKMVFALPRDWKNTSMLLQKPFSIIVV